MRSAQALGGRRVSTVNTVTNVDVTRTASVRQLMGRRRFGSTSPEHDSPWQSKYNRSRADAVCPGVWGDRNAGGATAWSATPVRRQRLGSVELGRLARRSRLAVHSAKLPPMGPVANGRVGWKSGPSPRPIGVARLRRLRPVWNLTLSDCTRSPQMLSCVVPFSRKRSPACFAQLL